MSHESMDLLVNTRASDQKNSQNRVNSFRRHNRNDRYITNSSAIFARMRIALPACFESRTGSAGLFASDH